MVTCSFPKEWAETFYIRFRPAPPSGIPTLYPFGERVARDGALTSRRGTGEGVHSPRRDRYTLTSSRAVAES